MSPRAKAKRRPINVKGAIDELVGALYRDGGHHKQASIEDALRLLGVDLDELAETSGEWEEGIPG